MNIHHVLQDMEEIVDAAEETFLLFAQSLPSQDLGFIDAKACTLDLEIGGRTLTIAQSPTLLSSGRQGGTTGAVSRLENRTTIYRMDSFSTAYFLAERPNRFQLNNR